MNKFIEEHKTEIILFILLIIIVFALFMYNLKGKKIYEDPKVGLIEETEVFNITYDINEYKAINMNKADLANLYHKDFMYLLLNDIDKTWNMLSNDAKESFKTKEEYFKYVKSIISNNCLNSKIISYKKDNKYANNKFELVDSENIKMIIYDEGIWNYKVDFIKKV